jgi:hypothetical protein
VEPDVSTFDNRFALSDSVEDGGGVQTVDSWCVARTVCDACYQTDLAQTVTQSDCTERETLQMSLQWKVDPNIDPNVWSAQEWIDGLNSYMGNGGGGDTIQAQFNTNSLSIHKSQWNIKTIEIHDACPSYTSDNQVCTVNGADTTADADSMRWTVLIDLMFREAGTDCNSAASPGAARRRRTKGAPDSDFSISQYFERLD